MRFISDEEIVNRAAYHPPTGPAIIEAHEQIRVLYRDLALKMNALLPEGPMKTRAINEIFDAMYQANACVAVVQDVHRDEPDRSFCSECGGPVIRLTPPGSKWQHHGAVGGMKHPVSPLEPVLPVKEEPVETEPVMGIARGFCPCGFLVGHEGPCN